MKLLICAGMTGGGIYPALAVLQKLRDRVENYLWVGSDDGIETEIVPRLDIPFETIPAAGLHGVGIGKLPGNILKMILGYNKARRVIHDFQPDVFFSTGGYLSVPVALASKRIPKVIFVPDIEPGLALKLLAKLSDHIAVTVKETQKLLPDEKRSSVTGYPLRNEITRWDKANALKEFDLKDNKPILLIFGGSKGARSINQAVYKNLGKYLELAQVIHICGKDNWQENKVHYDDLDSKLRKKYHPFPYLHENIGAALAAADLVVCRAGASTLGELPFYKKPALLIPYPHAWKYQKTNADYLVKKGGAKLLLDKDLDKQLFKNIEKLIHSPKELEEMQKNMGRISSPSASIDIANIILELGQKSGEKAGLT